MKQLLTITMVLAALVLSSCSEKRPAQRVSGSRDMARGNVGSTIGGGGAGVGAGQMGADAHWGKFYADYNTNFTDQVKLFFSPGIDTTTIGDINPDINGTDTGVWFWGEIALQGGTLRNVVTNGQALSVGANSRMEVRVYDSYAVSGQQPYLTAGYSGNVTGSVSATGGGFQADIIFRDNVGTLHLQGSIYSVDGTLENATFEGLVGFTNNCAFNPDTGACDGASQTGGVEQPMGNFKVEACHFFSCQ